LYDFEEPYRQMLETFADQLDNQAANAADAAERLQRLRRQPDDAEALQAAQEALEKLARENEPFDDESAESLDRTQEELDLLRKADELLAQADRLRAVIRQQRDLADRLGQLRDRDQLTPAEQQRAQRLAKEQDLLRQELEEITEELERAARACQDQLPKTAGDALALCEAIRELEIGEDQAEAARQARTGSGRRAHEAAESAAEKLESLQCDECNAEGAAGELALDGGLSLPKPDIEQALRQLAQGRDIPGLSSSRQGSRGDGFSGSEARTMVMGPHVPTGSAADPRSGRFGREGPAGPPFDGDRFLPGGPESLTPEARDGGRSAAGFLRGVPVGYREQAEAYFRRLAEED
jgi:hypothetical protein